MGEAGNLSESPTKSRSGLSFSLCKLLGKVLSVMILCSVILVGIIPLVYLHGSQRPYILHNNPLYKVFNSEPYSQLLRDLNNKKNNKIIINGNIKQGLKQFLYHFANIKSEKDFDVIIKQIKDYEILVKPYVKQIKYFIQQIFNFEKQNRKIWIIFSNTTFPVSQVRQIIAKHPKDKIIVALPNQQNIDQFKIIKFPLLTEQKLKQQMKKYTKLDQKEIQLLFQHFGSISTVFQRIDSDLNALSKQKILGSYFKQIKLLSKSDRNILNKLCSNGISYAQLESYSLNQFGCVFYKNYYYWNQNLAKFNYQLQVKKKCKLGMFPKKLRQKMEAQAIAKQQTIKKKIQDLEEKKEKEEKIKILEQKLNNYEKMHQYKKYNKVGKQKTIK